MIRDVITILLQQEEPFTTLKEGSGHQGNDRFEGYVPDLLEKIFAKLHRQYTIHLVEDSKYGSEENGQWTGMIGEVIDEVSYRYAIYSTAQHRCPLTRRSELARALIVNI